MSSNSFIVTIPFNELRLWNAKSYFKTKISSNFNLDKIGKHIKVENSKVNLSDFSQINFDILGIANDIGMYYAYFAKGHEFNQAYKIIKNDFIAFNPYRVNVGSIGIKKENLKGSYISPAYVVFSCKDTIIPDYLFIMLKTKVFNKLVKDNTSGSIRQNLTFKALSNIKIPIPSIVQQKEILARYNEKIEESKRLIKLSDYNEFDKVIFELLMILPVKKKERINNVVLETRKLSKLVTWGVSYNIGDSNPSDLIRSQKYDNIPLNIVAEINPTTVMPNDDTEVTFLPMECISNIYGEIIEKRIGNVAKSKGYTRFQNGDIIWAKITPCMQNGKSAVMENLLNGYGYGSTEFHVIRVNEKKALKEYVIFLLRMIRVREAAKEFFTGSAGQQRVNKEFLEKLVIPLPSICEQKRIVNILQSKKEKIKHNRKKAEALETQAKQEFEDTIFRD